MTYCKGIGRGALLAVVVAATCWFGLPYVLASETGQCEQFTSPKPWFDERWDERGFIEITQLEEGKVLSLTCPDPTATKVYSVDVLFTVCKSGFAGVMFMSNEDGGRHYGIFFDSGGRYYVYRLSPDGGTWEPVKSNVTHSLNKGLNVVNRIEIRVEARDTLFRFNGETWVSTGMPMPLGGRLRLAVATIEGTTTARFDNLCFDDVVESDMH
jgi:hypothetical protein